MAQAVRTAVIPAAGFGTRMLPITKAISKEMLPLVDKPIIQVVIEELVEAGISNIIIVTMPHKTDIADYFGPTQPRLAALLEGGDANKQALRAQLDGLQHIARITFIEQQGVYGTGTPVLCAAPYIGDEPFIYTFADDFFIAKENSYVQMLEAYQRHGAPVIACQVRTAPEDYLAYAYMDGTEVHPGEVRVRAMIEKPGKDRAPGNLASIGGFIVTPEVLPYLEQAKAELPAGRELFFNSAFDRMLAHNKPVIAREIKDAQYFDTGKKLEYMKTCVAMAARHPEIGTAFMDFLHDFIKEGRP